MPDAGLQSGSWRGSPAKRVSLPGSGMLLRIFRLCDIAVAFIFIAAAILKIAFPQSTAELLAALHPSLGTVWIVSAIAVWELALGNWIVLDSRSLVPRMFLLASLVIVTCASAMAVIGGIRDCGCFGVISLDPRATLAIDLSALTIVSASTFVRWRTPQQVDRERRSRSTATPSLWVSRALLASSAALAITAFWFQRETPRAAAAELRELEGLPLSFDIRTESSASVAEGAWVVIFVRGSCSDCRRILSDVERRTAAAACENLLVVNIEPKGRSYDDGLSTRFPGIPEGRWGGVVSPNRLPRRTPFALYIKDGVVRNAVSDDLLIRYLVQAIAGQRRSPTRPI